MSDDEEWLCHNCSKHMNKNDQKFLAKQGAVCCSPRCNNNYQEFVKSGRKIKIEIDKKFLIQQLFNAVGELCSGVRIGTIVDQSQPPPPLSPPESPPPLSPESSQLLPSLDHQSLPPLSTGTVSTTVD